MGVLKLSWLEENESTLKVVYRSSELRQKSCGSYYPFGMAQEGSWQNYPNNPDDEFYPPVPGDQNDRYTYNGKEIEKDLTGWLDYGHRWMDPSLGRFMTQDPLKEKFASWSPYHYAVNNPINVIDPDGRDTISVNRGELNKELSSDIANVWNVTLSYIRNGVETAVNDENGDPITFLMFGNAQGDDAGDNILPKDSYKLSFDQMSEHDGEKGWENTIRVTSFGVFIHPGQYETSFFGCKALCNEYRAGDDPPISKEETIQSLQTLRDVYKKNEDRLTGDKFILQTNRRGPPKAGNPPPISGELKGLNN